MGTTQSKSTYGESSSSEFFRRNRKIFGNKKKNFSFDLKNDQRIQKEYRIFKGLSSSQSIPEEFEKEFMDRYFDTETIKRILFNIDKNSDELYEQIDKEEKTYKSSTFPFKLYIAEPGDNIKKLDEEDGVSRIVRFTLEKNLVGMFGLTHAGLQIGDKLVHFFDNSFVKIDSFKANQALLLMNVSKSGRLSKEVPISPTPGVEHPINVIAEIIVEWNKKAIYDQHLRNCQDFVEDLCIQLNERCKLSDQDKISLSFEHNQIIRDYLDVLRSKPSKTGFHITYAKKHKRGLKEISSIESVEEVDPNENERELPTAEGKFEEFESHAQLDEWEEANKKKLTNQELEFLKGFHRAFQLRYYAELAKENPENWIIKLYEPSPYGCIRGNPTVN